MLTFLLMEANDPKIRRYIKSIEYYFPVHGHSYLPPDRVFGRIEKELRKMPIIKSPAEYHAVYERHGKVYVYGDDWEVYDFKSLSDSIVKKNPKLAMMKNCVWAFTPGKNIGSVFVSDSFAGGRQRFDMIKKTCKNFPTRTPKLVKSVTHISIQKRDDVQKLLRFVSLTPLEAAFYEKELGKGCSSKRDEVERPIEAE